MCESGLSELAGSRKGGGGGRTAGKESYELRTDSKQEEVEATENE